MADTKKNMSPAIAGVTGALIGAGLAVVAARALSDEKTRKTVVKKMNDFKTWGNNTMKQLTSQTEELRHSTEEIKQNIDDVAEKTETRSAKYN
jgi:hypothetical protein